MLLLPLLQLSFMLLLPLLMRCLFRWKHAANRRECSSAVLMPLSASRLQELQRQFADTRYLLVDEKSMMSDKVVGQMAARARQALVGREQYVPDADFAGLVVIFVG